MAITKMSIDIVKAGVQFSHSVVPDSVIPMWVFFIIQMLITLSCHSLFICSVMSSSLQPHGLQHARLSCPTPTPGACSNSCPSSAIQPSHPLSSPSPPALNLSQHQSFQTSQLFTLGGQSIGASASASVLPMSIQDWFPLGWTGFYLLAVEGTLKSLLQNHGSKASIRQCSALFMVQLSHPWWSDLF